MSRIKEIESKIESLGSGEFQRMCDSFLYKKGYENIVALGTHVGTGKTTKGTPDTYFKNDNGSYTFVAYTTQTSFNKIKGDLLSCFDESKTKIKNSNISNISKVIHCHISTNITPEQNTELYDLCKIHNVHLELFGLNRLSYDINEY